VGSTNLVTPEPTSDGHNGELGEDDSAANSGGNFLRALDTEANVTVVISNSDEGLETGALTGASLLLDGHDLQNLILKGGAQVEIDDFELFDGKREEVDLLKRLDLSILDQAS